MKTKTHALRGFILLALTFIATAEAGAQVGGSVLPYDSSLVLLSHVAGGETNGVDCDGNLAAIAELPGLRVWNVSDPLSPVEVGFVTTLIDYPAGVVLREGLALVPGGFKLMGMFDVYDSQPPALISYFDTPTVWDDYSDGLFLDGDVVFLATSATGIYSLGISDPHAPEILGRYGDYGHVFGIGVHNDMAYLAYQTDSGVYEGIHIVDVSDPTAMEKVGQYDFQERVEEIVIEDHRAYFRSRQNVAIVDLADPLNPMEVGNISARWAHNVSVVDSLAYIVTEGELSVWGVSRPENPVELARYIAPSTITGLAINGDLICLSAFDGFYLLRNDIISTGTSPAHAHSLPDHLRLDSVYPNPFQGTATVSFSLPLLSRVRVSVFDLLGREVIRVLDEVQSAGPHELTVDGSGLRSGVYLLQVEAGGASQSRTVVLLQ